jgi:hypothetical protein
MIMYLVASQFVAESGAGMLYAMTALESDVIVKIALYLMTRKIAFLQSHMKIISGECILQDCAFEHCCNLTCYVKWLDGVSLHFRLKKHKYKNRT